MNASKSKKQLKSVKSALTRALSDELAKAVSVLDPQRKLAADDIHEARKSIRRVRAWLRWAGDRKDAQATALDASLKRARSRLSQLRDAGSAIETIDRLRPKLASTDLRKELSAWRKQLRDVGTQAARTFSGRARILLHRKLVAAQTMLGTLPGIGKRRVLGGTTRSIKRARAAVEAIVGHHSAELRHAGRRRIRLLALQLIQAQRLGLTCGGGLDGKRVEFLAKTIGQENDLAVLLRLARRSPQSRSTELCDWIATRRLTLIARNDRLATAILDQRHKA